MAHEKILVVDDDDDLRDFTINCLETEGFNTMSAVSGKDALSKIDDSVDLVLLDLNLPDIDGEDVLKQLKNENELLPVIVVSGKLSVSSKVLTLGLGADDYVTKPFSEDELIARIKTNLKKYSLFGKISENQNADEIKIGNIVLDRRAFIATIDGKEFKLSPRIFSLLRYFMENSGEVIDKKTIYKNVWKDETFDDNTVTVFIRKLRRIIELDPGKPKYLLTIWGEGYKFTPSGKSV